MHMTGLDISVAWYCLRRASCLRQTGLLVPSLPGSTRCARSRAKPLNWSRVTTSARITWCPRYWRRRFARTGKSRTRCIGCLMSRGGRTPAQSGRTAPRRIFLNSRKSSSTSCVPILLDAKNPALASDENAPLGMMICGLNRSASIPYDVRVRKPCKA